MYEHYTQNILNLVAFFNLPLSAGCAHSYNGSQAQL